MSETLILWVFIGVFATAGIIGFIVIYLEVMMHKKGANQMSHFEMRRLYFAAGVLGSMGVVFILAMSMYYFDNPDDLNAAGKEIFDACSQIIPPIITLILGYYFGTSETRRQTSQDRMSKISDSEVQDLDDQVAEIQEYAHVKDDEND